MRTEKGQNRLLGPIHFRTERDDFRLPSKNGLPVAMSDPQCGRIGQGERICCGCKTTGTLLASFTYKTYLDRGSNSHPKPTGIKTKAVY